MSRHEGGGEGEQPLGPSEEEGDGDGAVIPGGQGKHCQLDPERMQRWWRNGRGGRRSQGEKGRADHRGGGPAGRCGQQL